MTFPKAPPRPGPGLPPIPTPPQFRAFPFDLVAPEPVDEADILEVSSPEDHERPTIKP